MIEGVVWHVFYVIVWQMLAGMVEGVIWYVLLLPFQYDIPPYLMLLRTYGRRKEPLNTSVTTRASNIQCSVMHCRDRLGQGFR